MTNVPPSPDLDESLPPMNGQDPVAPKFDPFNPEALRVSGLADVDIEQVLTTVPVRNPQTCGVLSGES